MTMDFGLMSSFPQHEHREPVSRGLTSTGVAGVLRELPIDPRDKVPCGTRLPVGLHEYSIREAWPEEGEWLLVASCIDDAHEDKGRHHTTRRNRCQWYRFLPERTSPDVRVSCPIFTDPDISRKPSKNDVQFLWNNSSNAERGSFFEYCVHLSVTHFRCFEDPIDRLQCRLGSRFRQSVAEKPKPQSLDEEVM